MKKNFNKETIVKQLLKNAEYVSNKYEQEIKKWKNLVLSKDNLFIPGYIPYIGSDYFNFSPKIMTYALSQNIHPDYNFIVQSANNWHTKNNIEEALNRQNIHFNKYGTVQMHPFDTGHLPILSGMLIYLTTKKKNINPIDKISATNLSKFSFRDENNNTTDNDESLKMCYEWFTKKELELLNPNFVICAGKKVYNILKQNKISIPILVNFPNLLVINRMKKDLNNSDEKKLELIISIFSKDFLNRNSSYNNGKKIIEIIKRDAHYFVRMFNSMEEQLKKYNVF